MRATVISALTFVVLPLGLSAQQQPRDLSRLDACKIITSQDVSITAKRKNLGFTGGESHCTYAVQVRDTMDTYELYLVEAAVMDSLLTAKGAQKGTRVSGVWNEAYIAPADSTPNQLALVAVKKGDMAIRLLGPSTSKDVLIRLARLVVDRIKYSTFVN